MQISQQSYSLNTLKMCYKSALASQIVGIEAEVGWSDANWGVEGVEEQR